MKYENMPLYIFAFLLLIIIFCLIIEARIFKKKNGKYNGLHFVALTGLSITFLELFVALIAFI